MLSPSGPTGENNECWILCPTLGLNVYRFLPLSDASHLSCHFISPDSFAANFISPNEVTARKSSASFASWAASFASWSAYSFPFILACPGDQDSSTSTSQSCNLLISDLTSFVVFLCDFASQPNVSCPTALWLSEKIWIFWKSSFSVLYTGKGTAGPF